MTDPSGGDPPPALRTVPLAVPGATQLVLVRHGEAVCNVEGLLGGPKGCSGLTPLGLAQAQALARRLERTGELGAVAALYTSVLPRAIETAALLAPALEAGGDGPPLEVRQDCELCELHPGDGDGLGWQEFLDRFGAPEWDVDPDRPLCPGAESWTGFVARASAGLESVAARHPGQLAVVVCHGGVIESAMARFLPFAGTGPDRRSWLRTEHASMTWFERPQGGEWVLRRYNDTTPVQQA
jgi:probable phosphoglycerate mutase